MRQIVKETFFDFTAQREGFTPFMYCDTLNLVTTGVGNLIDNGPRNALDISDAAMAPAMNLPWKFKGPGWTSKNPIAVGEASQAEIREAWIRTKLKEQESPGFNKRGGFAYAGLTPLTLDMDGLKALFNRTLVSFDSTLSRRFAGYENYPADAQLALLSMAWAMGPGFNFPGFKAACEREDFASAARQSFFKGGGGTIDARTGRNRENEQMFNTADEVVKGGADRDRLFFPGTVSNSVGALPANGAGDVAAAGAAAGAGVAAGLTGNPRITAAANAGVIIAGLGLLGWAGWETYNRYPKLRKVFR